MAGIPEAGDLVLVASTGVVYGTMRSITGQMHDHAVVVLDSSTVLHVSPPTIRTMPLHKVLMSSKKPLVLRPRLTKQERKKFLSDLRGLIGKKYSILDLFSSLGYLSFSNLGFPIGKVLFKHSEKPARKTWICTDAVLQTLSNNSPSFMQAINSLSCLDAERDGRLSSLTDFSRLSALRPDLLAVVQNVEIARNPSRTEVDDLTSWMKSLNQDFVFIVDDTREKSELFHDILQSAGTTFRYFFSDKQSIQSEKYFEYIRLSKYSNILYLAGLLFILKQGKMVIHILYRVVQIMLIRRLFVEVWTEVKKSKL